MLHETFLVGGQCQLYCSSFFQLQSKKRKLNKTSLKRKPPAVSEGGSDSNTDAANKVSAYSECSLSSLFTKQKQSDER